MTVPPVARMLVRVCSRALTGDLGEAQDLSQEAFCGAWQRWDVLSAYDYPVTWVRRVALTLANPRWRRLRVADRHLRRERMPVEPALQPDHVALVTALKSLPGHQLLDRLGQPGTLTHLDLERAYFQR